MNTKPNCLKCTHFYVTWEATHPRACRLWGFKSKELPSDVVYKTTGTHCPFFTHDTRHNSTQDKNTHIIDNEV